MSLGYIPPTRQSQGFISRSAFFYYLNLNLQLIVLFVLISLAGLCVSDVRLQDVKFTLLPY